MTQIFHNDDTERSLEFPSSSAFSPAFPPAADAMRNLSWRRWRDDTVGHSGPTFEIGNWLGTQFDLRDQGMPRGASGAA
ncbi:hypothetical protein SAMN00768000_3540 [Sulfobacillus thermosulfidooxidans DSM 9293]|uniref:Uncharacterized protein n=1 Tax=Sulfobacillus thermosulfidooxidans (strain DSM 9293 / VKM B-1269 / AT-1) TaxID=929705 RepID=A0A1W1WQE3_SULTA|nr:hypothetical protein SAMN00768000_3540 [Sulfobacillus thermosulfidooxidans DSM 9293]